MKQNASPSPTIRTGEFKEAKTVIQLEFKIIAQHFKLISFFMQFNFKSYTTITIATPANCYPKKTCRILAIVKSSLKMENVAALEQTDTRTNWKFIYRYDVLASVAAVLFSWKNFAAMLIEGGCRQSRRRAGYHRLLTHRSLRLRNGSEYADGAEMSMLDAPDKWWQTHRIHRIVCKRAQPHDEVSGGRISAGSFWARRKTATRRRLRNIHSRFIKR